KQGVTDAAQIGRRATTTTPCGAWRQHRLQQVPSFIAQIRRIQKVLHPSSLLIPLGQILSTHPKNDYSDTL
ncbi:MAG TPA: hypothetical protein VH595_13495, partial [Verrucomicrobiae bacterium]|nr:hypothetical protein [Verrucomicrobiae bacterium]